MRWRTYIDGAKLGQAMVTDVPAWMQNKITFTRWCASKPLKTPGRVSRLLSAGLLQRASSVSNRFASAILILLAFLCSFSKLLPFSLHSCAMTPAILCES